MAKKSIFSVIAFLLSVIIFSGCAEKRTDIFAPSSDPEWVAGVWLDCEQKMQKIEFRENDEFKLTGYGDYENLSLDGIYDLWSDGEHFKLDITETTDPYNFPVGDYSGSFIYDDENPEELTVMLNKGQSFPGTIQNADCYWMMTKIYEISMPEIIPIETVSISGGGGLGAYYYIHCFIQWELTEEFIGYNLYRCPASNLEWQKVNQTLLSSSFGFYYDGFTFDEYYYYPDEFPMTYIIEGILPDNESKAVSMPAFTIFELDPLGDSENIYYDLQANIPILTYERKNYNQIELEWNSLPQLISHNNFEFKGYKLYRSFDNSMLTASWEALYNSDIEGITNNYTDSVDWSDHFEVYYSLVKVDSVEFYYQEELFTWIRETPRYADVKRIPR